jgi:hypothetical protein
VTGVLRVPRRAALAAIAVLVATASVVSFAESYRGLYAWAHEHGLAGPWAVIWPLQVDVFIAVGELALFVALVDAWAARSRVAAWAVTGCGLAVSVAGNVGHVAGHSPADRLTAALPPLAAAAALAVGLGVLKRVVGHHRESARAGTGFPASPALAHIPHNAESTAHADLGVPAVPRPALNGSHGVPAEVQPFAAELARGEVPSIRRIRSVLHTGQPRAQEIQARLGALARTP